MNEANSIAMQIRTPFPYIGGKNRLSAEIKKYLPAPKKHRAHIEPFAGGLSVLFAVEPAQAYVNDAFSHLYHYWLAMIEYPEQFQAEYAKVINHERLLDYYFKRSVDDVLPEQERIVASAIYFYLKIHNSWSGKWTGTDDFRFVYSIRNSHKIKEDFNDWVEFFKKMSITVWNLDFREFFEKMLNIRTISEMYWYVDPPYYSSQMEEYYQHSKSLGFGPAEHNELFEFLCRVDEQDQLWVLSYNSCPEVEELYGSFNIRPISYNRSSTSAAINDINETTEFLISNKPFSVRNSRRSLNDWLI